MAEVEAIIWGFSERSFCAILGLNIFALADCELTNNESTIININEIIPLAEFIRKELPVDSHGPVPLRGDPYDKDLRPPTADQWEKLSKELDHIHSVIEKPIIISEFGADTVAGLHAVSDELYSEEYQVDLLKAYLDLANSRDYLVGMHVWNLADFRTSHSMMRIGGLNRKGVFTRDRTPKMGAHFLRSRWT